MNSTEDRKNIGMKRKNMEGEKGKKKVSDGQIQEVEEDEEEKMNAFYRLVRNIGVVHKQMLSGSSCNPKERMKEPTWTPSFTWEDFAGDAELIDKFFTIPSSSDNNEENQPENKKNIRDFDLNLSL